MESKFCSMCNIEKQIEEFYKKNTNFKNCCSIRSLKLYHEKKDKISNQRKIYYGKSKDKLLQIQNDRNIHFIDLLRSRFELESRWKAVKETADKNSSYLIVSENNQSFYSWKLFETT